MKHPQLKQSMSFNHSEVFPLENIYREVLRTITGKGALLNIFLKDTVKIIFRVDVKVIGKIYSVTYVFDCAFFLHTH
jgi:hypothetical protein